MARMEAGGADDDEQQHASIVVGCSVCDWMLPPPPLGLNYGLVPAVRCDLKVARDGIEYSCSG